MQKESKTVLATFQAARKRFRRLVWATGIVYVFLIGLLGFLLWDVYTHLSATEYENLITIFFQQTVPSFLLTPAIVFIPLYIVFYRNAREAYKHWLWTAPALLAFGEALSSPARVTFDVKQVLYQLQILEHGFVYNTPIDLHGNYRNTPIEILDINSKVFCAQIIGLECSRIFKRRISILEPEFVCRTMKKKKRTPLKTGDAAFDSHFACYAIEGQADYVRLTNTELTALKSIAAFPEIQCMFTFSGDHLYIGLQGNRGAYRPPLLRSFDEASAHKRITAFLEALLSIMDAFTKEK